MAQEKERKFELLYLPKGLTKLKIQQGYLMFDGAKHLRVRITQFGNHGVTTANVGYKTVKNKEEKEEFEFPALLKDAKKMMASTKIKLTKTRYKTEFEGNIVDIDIFPDGTRWVEIEFKRKLKNLPDYCGKEITGSNEFNNIAIAIKNSKK